VGHSTLTGDEGSTGSRRGEHEREDERPSNDGNWKGRKVVKVYEIFFTPDQIQQSPCRYDSFNTCERASRDGDALDRNRKFLFQARVISIWR